MRHFAAKHNPPAKTNSANLVPPIVHDVLRSPGQPLDANTRAFMEPRFGHDFSKVRVHADARAAASSLALGARAYTSGTDVVFGRDHYRPATITGRMLLAHELTHVLQQQRGSAGTFPPHTDRFHELEEEARNLALSVVGGQCVRVGGVASAAGLQLSDLSDKLAAANAGGVKGVF